MNANDRLNDKIVGLFLIIGYVLNEILRTKRIFRLNAIELNAHYIILIGVPIMF